MARWVPSDPNHEGLWAAIVAQSAITTFGYRAAPAANTWLLGSCQGLSTCTLTKTTREAPCSTPIFGPNAALDIGPWVPKPTTPSAPTSPAPLSCCITDPRLSTDD